jgi:hypothetical protein
MGAMVEAYAFDRQFRVELGEAITPLPVNLRYQIVSDLPLFADKGFAIEVLEDWDSERNGEVKTQASIQYHTLLLPAVEQTAAALEKLDRMLPCYGPDHEDRRVNQQLLLTWYATWPIYFLTSFFLQLNPGQCMLAGYFGRRRPLFTFTVFGETDRLLIAFLVIFTTLCN